MICTRRTSTWTQAFIYISFLPTQPSPKLAYRKSPDGTCVTCETWHDLQDKLEGLSRTSDIVHRETMHKFCVLEDLYVSISQGTLQIHLHIFGFTTEKQACRFPYKVNWLRHVQCQDERVWQFISESSTSEFKTKLGNAMVMSFKYGRVIFFIKDGFLDTNSFHSSESIFPSPLKSASLNVLSTIVSTTSSERRRSDSFKRANTISFNWWAI